MTLAQAGIASIGVASTAQTGMTSAGNPITATGTFTRIDRTTGTIADASFVTDPFTSRYLGDTTVSAAAMRAVRDARLNSPVRAHRVRHGCSVR